MAVDEEVNVSEGEEMKVQEEEEDPCKSDNYQPLLKKFIKSHLQAKTMFLANYGNAPPRDKESQNMSLSLKVMEYSRVKNMKPPVRQAASRPQSAPTPTTTTTTTIPTTTEPSITITDVTESESASAISIEDPSVDNEISKSIDELPDMKANTAASDKMKNQMVQYKGHEVENMNPARLQLLIRQRERMMQKPAWHAPWKLMRVISGHLGWVRAVAVDPSNEWFATGAGDRTIKIWDLASGTLKLTLTGHISTVRGLAISARSPYLFSVAEDKQVKCWDLEYNKVVRHYHGHLSGVYSCALHPTIDVLMTGGRDSTCRVWDIRTKAQVRVLAGHVNTVASIGTQPHEPQVITGSHDSTIRCWDLVSGKTTSVLTNHKKSVRAVGIHHSEYTFYSGSADNIKVWKCPRAEFLRNLSGHNAIINSMSLNKDNVLVSGADNGSLKFWDWKSGYNFQSITSEVQPGSLDSENGIFASAFDQTGSRLITCEADKTIKIYKEDDEASEETHPVVWKASRKRQRY